MRALSIVIIFVLFGVECFGQFSKKVDQFFTPADSVNQKRLTGAAVGAGASFTGMMIVLDKAWYSQYEREAFHFYDDSDQWLQIDKVGHAWTSYQGARVGHAVLKWAGVEEKKATIYGAPFGYVFLTGVEVLDGYSSGWGFSLSDVAANTAGMGLFLAQQLTWGEQRIQLKYSIEPVDYPNDPLLENRISDTYGTGFQKLLKDYNSQTYWLSVNPSMFMNEHSSFPKWLNASIGYSADGMLGGRVNYWCQDADIKPEDCPYNQRVNDFADLPRTRQFYLSADVDLTRIQTNSAFLRTLFGTVNMIKFPAPAIELNQGELKLRGLR